MRTVKCILKCVSCGYDLRSHTIDEKCPECGTDISDSIEYQERRSNRQGSRQVCITTLSWLCLLSLLNSLIFIVGVDLAGGFLFLWLCTGVVYLFAVIASLRMHKEFAAAEIIILIAFLISIIGICFNGLIFYIDVYIAPGFA